MSHRTADGFRQFVYQGPDMLALQMERTGSTLNPHTYVGRERYYRMPEADLYHLGFRD